ncbi:MAG: phosphoglucosamine mutase [Armatimonadota bacterium]
MRGVHTLKISISGVRGVVGDSLTPTLLVKFAQSFGTYTNGGTVVVGSDTRTSREMVKHAVLAGLTATGCQVVDVGICPVPTVQLAVEHTHASGGIAITASHNPVEWNALKFIRPDGIFLSTYQAEELLDIYHQGEFRLAKSGAIGRVRTWEGALEKHMRAVLDHIDVEAVRSRKFKVVADCCNGAGSVVTPEFLFRLGCEVIPINDTPNGVFPHPPEPIRENLSQLCEAVKAYGADLGFAQDADADRLAVVSERGEAISEEFTLSLAVEAVLSRRSRAGLPPRPVVANLSTTALVDHIAASYGCRVIRTPVGEVNVADTMKREGATIGGEGNGGVIWADVHYGRDSLAAMGTILQLLADRQCTVSELVESFPRYHMLKLKEPCTTEQAQRVLDAIKQDHAGQRVDTRDGVKVLFDDGAWLHARASRTEPVIRLIIEAPSEGRAEEIQESVRRYLGRPH